MPTKKKRLTQREKAERAKMKKELQAEGVLPPDKPRLNRKKFARETWAEWEEFLKRDPILAEVRLLRAVEFMAGPEVPKITPSRSASSRPSRSRSSSTSSSGAWKRRAENNTQSGRLPTKSFSLFGNYKEVNNTP